MEKSNLRETKGYKKYFFVGIIIIALGVTLFNTMKDTFGPLGTVFIAVGGLLFIIAMSKKRKASQSL